MVFLTGQGVILRRKGVILRGGMVTHDLKVLGLCSGSATLFWLDVRKHVKPCTPLPGRAAETRLDLSGFVWSCPGVRISRGWISGYPVDVRISSLDMSGYVRICLDTLVLTP